MSSNLPGVDAQTINGVVDSLKRAGSFDRFRRECLADVDTKPAYQNLKHRVEGFVGRFLIGQEWSPNLNKNQLRNNLRKQLMESSMLSNGVDRVIEQVVNAKINRDIKPQIDELVCQALGIDPNQWKEKIRRRDEFKRRQSQQQQNKDSRPDLNSSGQFNSNGQFPPATPPQPPGVPSLMQNMQTPPTSQGMMNAPIIPNVTGSVPPMPPNFPPPFSMNFPGFNLGVPGQQSFNMQPGFPTEFQNQGMNYAQSLAAGQLNMQGGFASQAFSSSESPLPNTLLAALGITASKDHIVTPHSNASEEEEKKKKEKEKEKKKLEPLTVESLLNVGKVAVEGNKKKAVKKEQEKKDEVTSQSGEDIKVDDSTTDMMSSQEEEPVKKEYRFAWDTEQMSDISVSSVHTSDLSSFEEDSDWSDRESLASSRRSGQFPKDMDVEEEEETITKEEDQVEETKVDETPVEQSPAKPKKLVALSYNYSDSDDGLTREERKGKMAKEKADRYQKRLQRRAELEAKRKDREEERKKQKDERKRLREEKAKEEKAKASEETPEVPAIKETKTAKKAPKSPDKKARSKQALKDQLREQKVMEKKMALRRCRTKNPKYFSEEFETSFPKPLTHSFVEEEEVPLEVEGENVEEVVISQAPVNLTQTEHYEDVDSDDSIESPARSPRSPRPRSPRSPRPRSRDRSPYSDISDESRDTSQESRGRRRRRSSSYSDSRSRSRSEDSESQDSKRRRESSVSSTSEMSPRAPPSPPHQRTPREPPPPPGPGSSQRYDTSDLYKPHAPSNRAMRYQSRIVDPEEDLRSRIPLDKVDFGLAARSTRKPVTNVDFGEAARRASMLPGGGIGGGGTSGRNPYQGERTSGFAPRPVRYQRGGYSDYPGGQTPTKHWSRRGHSFSDEDEEPWEADDRPSRSKERSRERSGSRSPLYKELTPSPDAEPLYRSLTPSPEPSPSYRRRRHSVDEPQEGPYRRTPERYREEASPPRHHESGDEEGEVTTPPHPPRSPSSDKPSTQGQPDSPFEEPPGSPDRFEDEPGSPGSEDKGHPPTYESVDSSPEPPPRSPPKPRKRKKSDEEIEEGEATDDDDEDDDIPVPSQSPGRARHIYPPSPPVTRRMSYERYPPETRRHTGRNTAGVATRSRDIPEHRPTGRTTRRRGSEEEHASKRICR